MKVVLPVITHSEPNRESRSRLPIVLDVGADLLLEKRHIAVEVNEERFLAPVREDERSVAATSNGSQAVFMRA